MIKDIIFHQNRDNYHVNALKAINVFNGKIASFSLYDRANKLGWGQGVVFYEGKKPTGDEIQSFVNQNLQDLFNKKHIVGSNFLDKKSSYVRFITKL